MAKNALDVFKERAEKNPKLKAAYEKEKLAYELEKLKENLMKAWIAIDCDTVENGFYSGNYLKEKIIRILEGTMVYHELIDQAYLKGCFQKRSKYVP